MRAELENMERVANYLTGKLTEGQRQVFEADLLIDNDLQDQLHFQTDLSKVIERRVLRNEISQAGKQFAGYSGFSWKMMVITAVVIAGGIITYVLFNPTPDQENSTIVTTSTEEQSIAPVTAEIDDQQVFIDSTIVIAKPRTLKFDAATSLKWQQMRASQDTWINEINNKGLQDVLADAGVITRKQEVIQPIKKEFIDSVIAFEETTAVKQVVRSGTWWKKTVRSSALPSLRETKTRLKNKALIIVIDGAGNKLPNVAIDYGFYGELRSGTTDKNGEFAFLLYDQITSSVTLVLPDHVKVDLTEVVFQPKKVTYIQVDSYTIDSPVNSVIER